MNECRFAIGEALQIADAVQLYRIITQAVEKYGIKVILEDVPASFNQWRRLGPREPFAAYESELVLFLLKHHLLHRTFPELSKYRNTVFGIITNPLWMVLAREYTLLLRVARSNLHELSYADIIVFPISFFHSLPASEVTSIVTEMAANVILRVFWDHNSKQDYEIATELYRIPRVEMRPNNFYLMLKVAHGRRKIALLDQALRSEAQLFDCMMQYRRHCAATAQFLVEWERVVSTRVAEFESQMDIAQKTAMEQWHALCNGNGQRGDQWHERRDFDGIFDMRVKRYHCFFDERRLADARIEVQFLASMLKGVLLWHLLRVACLPFASDLEMCAVALHLVPHDLHRHLGYFTFMRVCSAVFARRTDALFVYN